MKSFAIFCLLLVVILGCATHKPAPYVYTPPVVVGCNDLVVTSDCWIASVTFTNVSTDPVWYDACDTNHPIYSIQWKGQRFDQHNPPDLCDLGGGYELPPGQSCSFHAWILSERALASSFRVGVWVWTDQSPTIPADVFWSDYISK